MKAVVAAAAAAATSPSSPSNHTVIILQLIVGFIGVLHGLALVRAPFLTFLSLPFSHPYPPHPPSPSPFPSFVPF